MRRSEWLVVILIVLILAFIAGRADAQEADGGVKQRDELPNFWRAMPKAEWLFDAALAADMLTTYDIRRHPELEEKNVLLGAHPNGAQIAGYGLLMAGLHAAITYELVREDVPTPVVAVWELVTIGIETAYTVNNYRLGLRCRF